MKETISILGGGWSAALIDKTRLPGLVIGVNDSAILAPCRVAVTMDRLWTEARFGALKARHIEGALDEFHVRRAATKNVDAGGEAEWVKVFDNDHTSVDMTSEPGRLNGTNSGVCALNLAFQLKPRRIVLFGFDMNRSPTGSPYWFAPYSWAPGGATKPGKYQAWAAEFALIAKACASAGIEVLNASPVSAITAFERIKPEKVLR